MADAELRTTLRIRKGNIRYTSDPTFFQMSMAAAKGPTPGEILVPRGGREILLGEVAPAGWTFFKNNDSDNFLTAGVYDGSRFYPFLEFPAGIGYPVILSRYLNQEFVGTGTNSNADINKLYVEPDTAALRLLVQAFSR